MGTCVEEEGISLSAALSETTCSDTVGTVRLLQILLRELLDTTASGARATVLLPTTLRRGRETIMASEWAVMDEGRGWVHPVVREPGWWESPKSGKAGQGRAARPERRRLIQGPGVAAGKEYR